MSDFRFGHPGNAGHSKATCCGKPVGCSMKAGCLLLAHPWKRKYLLQDVSAENEAALQELIRPRHPPE